jgi:hypothetical protein
MPRPSRRRRLRAPLVAALAFVALPALAANPAVHRVSDLGIANSGVAQSPPEDQPRFSPDGKWAVWTQDAEISNAWNLYAARRWEGSTPARLSAAYTAGQGIAAFAITPDSQRVVYLAGSFSTGLYQLWSVAIDGSSSPVRLNPTPPANGGVTGFEIAPNGSRVVFRGDLPTDEEFALWSVPVAGPSAQAVQLSPAPQVAGSDVNAFVITADSQRAVYDGVLRNNAVDELWSSPLAGGAAARLNPQLAGAFGVDPSPAVAFRSSADGSRVLYVGDFRTPGRFELFTVPAAGPATSASAISVTAVPQGNVAEFELASGTPKVVFLGDLLVAGTVQLWASAVDGSGTPVRLSHASPVSGGNVTGFAIASGASPRVLFRGDAFVDERYDLYQVAITGGGPTRLNSVSVATGDVETDFAISPDGTAVVFRGNLNSADKIELYSAASNGGSGSAQRLSPSSTPTGANVDAFAIDATSTTVVYAGDVSTDGRTELWSVPIAGPASSGLRLHPAPGANQNVTAFALSPGGADVAFIADLVVDQRFDLWWAPLAGPAATAPVAVTAVAGGNVELPLVWADDGHGVLFLGDLETDQRFPLWDADTMIFRADFEGDDTAEWSSAVP